MLKLSTSHEAPLYWDRGRLARKGEAQRRQDSLLRPHEKASLSITPAAKPPLAPAALDAGETPAVPVREPQAPLQLSF